MIVDIGYVDLPLLFLLVENKLSSLHNVTIARPRTANEIH
jgi:hypothetical protein